MATWADRRDAYVAQQRAYARDDAERNRVLSRQNAMNDVLAQSYEQPQAAQPAQPFIDEQAQYMGQPQPGNMLASEAVPERAGGLNIQNALGRLYQSGQGDIAMKIEQEMADRAMKRKQLGQRPSAVEVYEYWNKLPNDQAKADFMRTQRANQIIDIGSGFAAVNPVNPAAGAIPIAPRTLKPAEQLGYLGNKAATEKTAETMAKGRAEAGLDLPKAEAQAENTVQLVEELKAHPGLKYSVGAASLIPKIPGTAQADFMVRLDQMKGKQFLEAYQTLKGGGQITEVEGKKAQDAMARMDRAQSEPEFRKSLDDFQDAVRTGTEKLRQKATGQTNAPSAPKIGTRESGYMFMGGNPADSKNWKKVQ